MLDLLLPQRCLVCGAGGGQLCAGCRARLPRSSLRSAHAAARRPRGPWRAAANAPGRRLAFATARAAVAYDDGVRRLVAGWKERGLRHSAETAAEIVAERLPRPAPASSRSSRRTRAGDSTAATTRPSGSPARSPQAGSCRCEPLLERARAGRASAACPLPRGGATSPAPSAVTAVHGDVILVDDVYTSGATVYRGRIGAARGGRAASTS